MIIMSQNGEFLVNFEEVQTLFIQEPSNRTSNSAKRENLRSVTQNLPDREFSISATFRVENSILPLGTYSTLERTKEILADIFEHYSRYMSIKRGQEQRSFFNYPKAYRMPEA